MHTAVARACWWSNWNAGVPRSRPCCRAARGPAPSERAADKKRIRDLEKDLRRKEKALAETAALLVLPRKYEALWTDGEDV